MAQALRVLPPIHRCEISVRGSGDERRHTIDCDLCGYIGTTQTMDAAQAVVRIHEEYIAPLLKAWSLPS